MKSQKWPTRDDPAQLRARLRKMVDSSRLLEGTRYQETLRRRCRIGKSCPPRKSNVARPDTAERRKLLDLREDFLAKNQPVPRTF